MQSTPFVEFIDPTSLVTGSPTRRLTGKGGASCHRVSQNNKKPAHSSMYKLRITTSAKGETIYAQRPCPRCGKTLLIETPKSTKGVDFVCSHCGENVEIKQGEELLLNQDTVREVIAGTYQLPSDTYVALHQAVTPQGILNQEYRWSRERVTKAIKDLPKDERKWHVTSEKKPRVILGLASLGDPFVVGSICHQNKLAAPSGFRYKVHGPCTRGNRDLRELITERREYRLEAKRREDMGIQKILLCYSCEDHTGCDIGCSDCDFKTAFEMIIKTRSKKKARSTRLVAKRHEDVAIQEILLCYSCEDHTGCDIGCSVCDFKTAFEVIIQTRSKKKARFTHRR